MATFSMSLPPDMMEIIDREAEKEHRSRSAQVTMIIEDWIKNHKEIDH